MRSEVRAGDHAGGFCFKGVVFLLIAFFSSHYAMATSSVRPSPIVMSGSAGEWGYRCAFPSNNPAKGPELCIMEQSLMVQNKTGKAEPLGAVVLARATSDTNTAPLTQRPWRLTAIVPLEVSLQAPVRVSIEHSAPIELTWKMCMTKGCMASLDLTSAQAALFQQGKVGHIMVDKVLGGTLTINFALDGADVGMKQLEGWITHSPFSH